MSTTLLSPGIELITEEGGSPITIDLFQGLRHLGIFASAGSGKTVLELDILTHALASGISVFALDFPRIDGRSTLRNYTQASGGDYTNVLLEGGNLFELADLGFRDNFIDLLCATLLGLVLESSDDPCLQIYCREVLSFTLKQFFDNPSIQTRYTNAIEDGIGSQAWADTPTLTDFLPFCTPESLVSQGDPQKIGQVCEIINQCLTFWLNGHIGRAIASPSTKQTSSNLRVFEVREGSNPDSPDEQLALQLVALHYILRSAYLARQSIVYIPTLSRLCKSDVLSNLIASLCAGGAKFGIRMILTDQSIHPISKSNGGKRIFQNLETILIGRTTHAEIQTLTTVLGLPPNLLYRNTSDSFVPDKQDRYSKWMVTQNGTHTLARHYASEALLEFSSS